LAVKASPRNIDFEISSFDSGSALQVVDDKMSRVHVGHVTISHDLSVLALGCGLVDSQVNISSPLLHGQTVGACVVEGNCVSPVVFGAFEARSNF